ncbi:MAG: BMP family ABC transporter substrate-binding protein [Clostridiales bacterium]|nr:BMP family ABC transporter substrate-binding protein [Clostridiales bacterium]MDY3746534.1 BMP family ABC transporter substrate-binding protein [Lachnospiraceae bacterium]
MQKTDYYYKAQTSGLIDYYAQTLKGKDPYLPVLDDILNDAEIISRVSLGLVDIPLNQIVGTSTAGRTSAFASNFMPLLGEKSEFAHKWTKLSDVWLLEGQREPVKAFEYMNKFYIVEGNKRVSVSKFFNTVSVYGDVTRIIPKRSNDKENIIYYEFLDFYEITEINYIWFSKPGAFSKLLDITCGSNREKWSADDRKLFRARYLHFSKAYENKLKSIFKSRPAITVADAFLSYIVIYGYENILDASDNKVEQNITKIWSEFLMLEEDNSVALLLSPEEKGKSIFNKLFPTSSKKLNVAFINDKSPETSAWIYSHELGRMHLQHKYGNEISTKCFNNIQPGVNDEEVFEQVIHDNYDLIFTTTPQLMLASLKTAIKYPDKKILNCSLNFSHKYIRTYYTRMYEAKFLTGVIAGVLTPNNKIGYLTDYPIYGMTANINAFALGAKMVNPFAKIYLEWTTRKDHNYEDTFKKENITLISGKDMITPEHLSREFGLYMLDNEKPLNLAMPICHWGIFYEKLVQSIMNGTWKDQDNSGGHQALNYWWGMDSGVIDVIGSQRLPDSINELLELFKANIMNGTFSPFYGRILDQRGNIRKEKDVSFSPEEIISMNWLVDNVRGNIPDIEDLKDDAKPIVSLQGIINKAFITL